jgi:hypothetical protein
LADSFERRAESPALFFRLEDEEENRRKWISSEKTGHGETDFMARFLPFIVSA